MGHFKFISKDILNIVSLRIWKSYLRKLNNEFKQVYLISVENIGYNYITPQNVIGRFIEWYPDLKIWHLNNMVHRVKGPAIKWSTGEQFWFLNGYLHNSNGPAMEYPGGHKFWYLNGKQRSENEFNEFKKMGHSKFISNDILNIVSLRVWKSHLMKTNNEFKKVYHISFDDMTIFKARNSDGPCVHWSKFTKLWFFNGNLHRNENQGPAYQTVDGYYKSWRVHGKFNRIKGPAVEWSNGDKLWYLNGVQHRIDGPALDVDGTKEFWVYGQRHRTDGPAIEYRDGRKYWYLNDILITEDEFNKRK